MNRALFLDRDGVINIDRHYIGKIEDFQFQKEIFNLLHHFQRKDYLLIIVSNQSGVGRGYFARDNVESIHTYMIKELRKRSIKITAIYYCTSFDNRHPDRKPNPGMLIKAQKRFDIDMKKSILIGDRKSDIVAGKRAGVGCNILFQNSIEIKQ